MIRKEEYEHQCPKMGIYSRYKVFSVVTPGQSVKMHTKYKLTKDATYNCNN